MPITIHKNTSQDKTFIFIQRTIQLIDNFLSEFNLPRVIVSGCLNTGKSTLVGNLLEFDSRVQAHTPCPIYYTCGNNFSARVWIGGHFSFTGDPQELTYLLKMKTSRGQTEKVEATFNHRLLKLCNLIDTPGIDSPAWKQTCFPEKIFAGASQIIFLFHQRGIQVHDWEFLKILKDISGPSGYKLFSFWLNCNTGKPDGTSLADTRTVLKELFGSEIPVYILDLSRRSSVNFLRSFLQLRLAGEVFSGIEAGLKRKDSALPQKLAQITAMGSDMEYLVHLWSTRKRIQLALTCKQEINVLREMKTTLLSLQENKKIFTPHYPSLVRNYRSPNAQPEKVEASTHLSSYRGLDIKARPRFVVAAWGPFSSGKTTFFNAIMGEAILPAEDKPTTSYLTSLHYGREKMAILNFHRQITISLAEPGKGKLSLKLQEIINLENYLQQKMNIPEITGLELLIAGKYQTASRRELLAGLEETKARLTLPEAQKNRKKTGFITAARLTFKEKSLITYALDSKREEFRYWLNGPFNFFLETVHIYHPAKQFQQVTFLDTPGIDSTYAHHRQISLQALDQSNLLLIFIHGKQLVSDPYKNNILKNMAGRFSRLVKAGRVLFLINFADTLTPLEREKAANFVRQKLLTSILDPPVFLISSLAALNGYDHGFEKVMRRINGLVPSADTALVK